MRLDTPTNNLSSNERLYFFIKVMVLIVLILPSSGALKRYVIDKGFVAEHQSGLQKVYQLAENLLLSPRNWFYAKQDLPLLKIDIKYDDWLLLENDRRTAFERGIIPDKRHEVNATINFEQNQYKSKVRLQGDMLDHVDKANRWSLKVSLKKKKALFSSRKFALVAPSVRVNQGPSLFAKSLALSNFDVISPQHIPVNVVLNGVDWGVMLFEQGFSQELLAVNNRTEGLIVRLDLAEQSKDMNGAITRTLKPRVLQRKTILGNHALTKQRQIALSLLNDFIDKKRSASDVFDAKRLGQYLATVDLWGAWHALTWNNWRWYYNPHTAKLEPIQSDVAVTPAAHIWLMRPPSHRFEFSKLMLKDETVKGHYIASKKALVAGVNGQLIPQLQQFETKFISQLHGDSPLLAPFNFNVMKQQARCWQNKYSSQDCANINEVSSELHAQMSHFSSQANWDLKSTLKGEGSELVWYVHNTNNQKLIVKSIEGVINQEETISLESINDDLPMAVMPGERARISFDKSLTAINVSATLDNKKSDTFSFIKNVAPLSFIPRGKAMQSTSEYTFIEKGAGVWRFKPGTWQINHYLVTPPNTQVTMPKGTRLEFSRYGGLMVFGQLQVNGTISQPVVLTKQSDVKEWSGLSVFSPNENTVQTINNLQISYASSPKLGLWQPRGAIYFVHGKVNIQQLSITDNMSEDGLNIINAEIDINGLTIRNALSDAFDCDFCQGTVRNSQFSNIGFRSGGDGLDVSGSKIKLINARFNNVRDKAISGGERSHLNVKRAHFENVNFGLVAKDDTTISAAHITARNVQHQALMSYSKKPIFGAAQMQVDDFQCLDTNCIDKISVENGSILNVNGQYISPKKLDVKKMYKTIMKSDKPQ